MPSNPSTFAGDGRPPLAGSPENSKTAPSTVGESATKAKDQVTSVAQAAVETVDQNRGAAAHMLANAASTIRDSATHLPGGDGVTRLAKATAENVDTTAQYVREHAKGDSRRRWNFILFFAPCLGDDFFR